MSDETISRRGALECMLWAGNAVLWTVAGGVPASRLMSTAVAAEAAPRYFAQISDSHVGFNRPANPDVLGTLREAVARVNALAAKPAFVIHTGDVTHLAKDSEFDDADQILKGLNLPIFYVPGEHDIVDEGRGKSYLARYGKGALGTGWHSFDDNGVHYVGLVNVADLKAGGMGSLGADQLAWLAKDLADKSASTPIVVFAHIPLWTVSAEWGWGTSDAEQALKLLARFGSVTVLNGHIHQVMRKVEGNVQFHTARSTAFPQPAPGTAPSAGPMTVPAGELRKVLGIAEVTIVAGQSSLAVTDEALA